MGALPTVVHVIGTLTVGGAERVLVRLCRLTADRCQHHVVTLLDVPGYAAELTSRGIPVEHWTQWGSGSILRKVIRTRRKAGGRVVIHGWTYPGCVAATALHAISGRGTDLIWDVRSAIDQSQTHSFLGRMSLRLAKQLSSRPRLVNFNSEAGRAVHLRQGWRVRQHSVIHNPIPSPDLTVASQSGRELRQRLGIDEGALVIAVVARDAPNKRLELALEAVRIVNGRLPAAIGIHAGRLRPGSPLAEGHPFMRTLGEIQDTQPLIAAADVLLLSSDVEGFPNVVAEAIQLGTPVVSTAAGDAELIVGEFGRICPPRNPAALADGVVAVFQAQLKHQPQCAQSARDRLAALCAPDRIAQQYVELWSTLSN